MRTTDKYILDADGQTPIPCDFLLEWAHWFETADRQIALTPYPEGVSVSTVFLGIASGFDAEDAPLLFETLIRGGEHNHWTQRYATYQEAIEGHKEACRLVERDEEEVVVVKRSEAKPGPGMKKVIVGRRPKS